MGSQALQLGEVVVTAWTIYLNHLAGNTPKLHPSIIILHKL